MDKQGLENGSTVHSFIKNFAWNSESICINSQLLPIVATCCNGVLQVDLVYLQMITLGGDAELELVDSLDPFSEGIVFSVRPPQKSWKNISNLSGGEKTLSSLALVSHLLSF